MRKAVSIVCVIIVVIQGFLAVATSIDSVAVAAILKLCGGMAMLWIVVLLSELVMFTLLYNDGLQTGKESGFRDGHFKGYHEGWGEALDQSRFSRRNKFARDGTRS